jgi:hypothetical protein
MKNYKKHTKKTPPKPTPRLDKLEQSILRMQERMLKLSNPRHSFIGLGKQVFKPNEINFGGFNDRMFASSADSLVAIILLHNIMQATAAIIFGEARARQFYGGLLGKSAIEIMQQFQAPGFLDDWLTNNFIYFCLSASIMISCWIYTATSPGKWVTRLRVVDATTGKAPTTRQSIVRYLSYFLSALPFGLGFFWIIWDKKKQGWHDKIANTYVIRVQGWSIKKNPESFFPQEQPAVIQEETLSMKSDNTQEKTGNSTQEQQKDDKTLA